MKLKIALIFTFTLLLGASANAQLTITKQQVKRLNDSIQINLTVVANRLDIKSRTSLRLEPTLTGSPQADVVKTLLLPSLLYTGTQRERLDARNAMLTGVNETAVIQQTQAVKSTKSYTTNYQTTLLYASWMDHATIGLNHYAHDCCNEQLLKQQTLIADLNLNPAPAVVTPPVWSPNPAVYSAMVSFMKPKVESVKHRAAFVSANIDYPRNVYKVMPIFGKNEAELKRVDTLVASVTNNELITLNSINIMGYASPDGSYKANEKLAMNRSLGFKEYLKASYGLRNVPIQNEWVAEDWRGLIDQVVASELQDRNAILEIIQRSGDDTNDARERLLKSLKGGAPYQLLLETYFPSLRRIELKAAYTVAKISDSKAKELIYTRPELLSLEEMYSVALFYKPGSEQYREVYEIAARQYPKDVIANNNAAAALLLQGKTKEADVYLDRIKNNPMGLINKGVSAYIQGDLELAKQLFEQATQNGDQKGEANTLLIQTVKK